MRVIFLQNKQLLITFDVVNEVLSFENEQFTDLNQKSGWTIDQFVTWDNIKCMLQMMQVSLDVAQTAAISRITIHQS